MECDAIPKRQQLPSAQELPFSPSKRSHTLAAAAARHRVGPRRRARSERRAERAHPPSRAQAARGGECGESHPLAPFERHSNRAPQLDERPAKSYTDESADEE